LAASTVADGGTAQIFAEAVFQIVCAAIGGSSAAQHRGVPRAADRK
jgi:hypothetical protein